MSFGEEIIFFRRVLPMTICDGLVWWRTKASLHSRVWVWIPLDTTYHTSTLFNQTHATIALLNQTLSVNVLNNCKFSNQAFHIFAKKSLL